VKYFFICLCLGPVVLNAQKTDSIVIPKYQLTIEVRDLDTEAPIAKSMVKIIGNNGQQAEYRTNDSGLVAIDTFIKPETIYQIEVSCKGYLTHDQQSFRSSQLSTVGLSKSTKFWKVFRFKEIHIICILPTPTVPFMKNSAVFKPGTTDSLDYYVYTLERYEFKIEITVFTSKYVSLTLAQKRIDAIQNYLLGKGVPQEKMIHKTAKGDMEMVRIIFRPTEYKE